MSLRAKVRELMEDEERAKLVRQVTEETEKFIASLPKNEYQDGWPQDKWEEEMEKHPLFMSQLSEDQNVSPLIEALQSLKYDPECNDPTELAKAHKEDGNEQFRLQKFEFAVTAYSEGLKAKSEDTELNAVLYTNRAAAYYHMGNLKKSLEDVTTAKALNPSHVKAIHRGALCCLDMGKYDDCISWCGDGLKLDDNDKTLLEYKEKAEEKIANQERLKPVAGAKKTALAKLIRAVKGRGINIAENGLTEESIVCNYNGVIARVQLTKKAEIVWPVVLLYPQYYTTDFIKRFNENTCFYDQFRELFRKHPIWDINNEYTPDNLKVYFCGRNEEIVPVDVKKSLKFAMRHKRFQVISGTLNFYITCSKFDETYRSQNCVADD